MINPCKLINNQTILKNTRSGPVHRNFFFLKKKKWKPGKYMEEEHTYYKNYIYIKPTWEVPRFRLIEINNCYSFGGEGSIGHFP